MSLKCRKRTGLWFRLVLSAAVMLTMLPQQVLSDAESAETHGNTEYIVKYRDGEASLMNESTAPFDVVDETQMDRLLRTDALEWYEKDGDAVLMEDVFNGFEVGMMESASEYYDTEVQWNLSLINAETSFRVGALGQGIRVGVVDSGISPHTGFGGRLLAGHNYMKDAEGDPVKEADTVDEYGHGTRVAGLIAAEGISGYIGAAPAAELVPLKCTDGKTVKISTICKAIYGAVDDYDCNVLNLSLGVQTEYQSLKEAVEYAAEQGVVLVSAAGNGGSSEFYYPAKYDTVIGVGSVDQNGDLYYRSNHNSSVFLTAPGVSVSSTDSRGGYSESTGCSFAVPQVAAAAAVMLGIDGTLTPEIIMKILSETAWDRGAEGYDEYYGYGILNLGGCVSALKSSGGEDPGELRPDPQQPQNPQQTVSPGEEWGNPEDVTDPENPSDTDDDPTSSGTESPSTSPGTSERTDPEESSRPSSPSEPAGSPDSPGSSGSPGSVRPTQPSVEPTPVSPSESTEPSGSPEPVSPTNDTSPSGSQDQQGYSRCQKDQSCPLSGFSDLNRSTWYHDGIHFVLENSIMNGLGNSRFGPGDSTSRAMIVTMLWRMEGSPEVDGTVTFKDVPDGQWYTDAVRWASSKELVTGYSSTAFGPDDNVSREQLAAILYRYAGNKGNGIDMKDFPDCLGNYTDTEQISSWALDAMRWTVGKELIQGMTDTILSPKTEAARAQVATMLMRFSQKILQGNTD